MIEAGVLHGSRTLPRAGDGAPTLRLVVEALIDGQPVKWEAAARRGATPFERRMTQQVRALARLSASATLSGGEAVGRVAQPHVLEYTLSAIAVLQIVVAVTAAVWLDAGGATQPARVACLLATVAAALALTRRGRRMPAARLLGHVLLLVAAWQARPLLEPVAAAIAPLWAWASCQAVLVEAFLPLATWRLAHACPRPVRLGPFERLSTLLLAAALACSISLAVASAVGALTASPPAVMHGRIIPAVALAWGLASAVTIAVRSRAALLRRARLPGIAVLARWRPAIRDRVDAILGLLTGTHAAALAALGADLQHARSLREVTSALMVHAEAGLHPCTLAMVAPATGEWRALAGSLPPLSAESAIACLLASADEATRVDADASVYRLLPAADREWLISARVATIVRLASREGDTLAALLVGMHADGRRHSRRERAFIAAAGRIAAVALSAIERPSATADCAGPVDDLSFECDACGSVSVERDRCECGSRRHLAALPSSLHGMFRIERRIGRGGMGVVYLASDLRLNRPVALKTLPSLSSVFGASLRSEARAMAAVTHPSIAVLYGLEEWRGTPILVTEYLAGGTLSTRLAAGPVEPGEALALGISVAGALAALHGRGWLHRDVKPSNIGFCGDGTPKLLDFGLTMWRPKAGGVAESLAGTPQYLSPELLEGEPASERDDLWALALVLVEMITGAHPFHADNLEDALQQVRFRAPLRWGATVPDGVAAVLTRALHPIASRRFATAQDFAAALRNVAVPS